MRYGWVLAVAAAFAAGDVGAAVDPAKDIWCAVDFDGPIVVGGRVFKQELPARGRTEGRFGAGYHFKGSGRRDVLIFDDPAVLGTFPTEEGSFAAWIKKPGRNAAVWGRHTKWGNNWGFDTSNFRTASRCYLEPNGTYEKFPAAQAAFAPSNVWMHVAATWSEDEIVVYANGKRVMSRMGKRIQLDPMTSEPSKFYIGGYGVGSGLTDVILDEFFVFNRALDEDEIGELVSAQKPLRGAGAEFFSSSVDFAIYRRDETNAALRFSIEARRPAQAAVTWQVADLPSAARELQLAKGVTPLQLPFDVWKLSAGKYPWSYGVKVEGRVIASDKGTLEVLPASADGGWTFLSWGGSKPVHSAFMRQIGLNTYNLTDIQAMREKASEGFYVNPRVEIPRKWAGSGLDVCNYEGLREETASFLAPLAGSGCWRTTLVNSEVYPTSLKAVVSNATFRAYAKKELGIDPDDRINNLGEIRSGVKLRGVIPETDPTFRTIKWFDFGGMPAYRQNLAMGEAIHALQPDNIVWSEPIFFPGGLPASVDMAADWYYECFSTRTLVTMMRDYAKVRQFGKRFMPTLGMCYYPSQGGVHPKLKGKDGKPRSVRVTQSADELMIKSWMAIGAVRADALSMYEADAWEYGVSNAVKLAVNFMDESVYSVTEPDAPRRYGEFVRERLMPAALLLKGVENARAKVALLAPSEIGYCNAHGYGRGYDESMIGQCLAEAGINFDFLCDGELTAGTLSRYDYLVLQMAGAITETHDAALKAASAKGAQVVLDAEGAWAKDRYANAIALTNRYIHVWNNPGATKIPFNDWLATVKDGLAAKQSVHSDCDGRGSWTFTKKHAGAAYAVVVNDFRREGGSLLNTFKTGSGYRPCGAAHEIATTFRLPAGSAVYAFNDGKGALELKDGVYAAEYAPAEGKLFCIYPRPLKALSAQVEGTPARAVACALSVRMTDAADQPAPGRQIVRLTLRDPSGVCADASGLYTLERGTAAIPLRFARDSSVGTWTWKLDDLTAGFSAGGSFEVK